MTAAAAKETEPLDGRRYLTLLLAAAALGVPAAFLAAMLTALLHQVEHLVWVELPAAIGVAGQPWWLVITIPAVAGAIVAFAIRLPGAGGSAAVDGLGLHSVTPRELAGVLLAALASISLGPVVGPEAPLMAIGFAVGALAAQLTKQAGQATQILVFAGAFAAISTAFGGPLPAALLLFEFVALSGMVSATAIGKLLLPGFLAAGVGTLVFTGFGDWAGIQSAQLALTGLAAYPTVRAADVALSIPMAALIAALVVLVLRGGHVLAARLAAQPKLPVLVTGGAVIGLLAVIARAITDAPVDQVLFSGAAAMPDYLAEDTASVLLVVGAAKALAMMVTAATFFRGGLVFPSVALGVLMAVALHLLVPAMELTPAVAAGMAAGATAALRAPFFGALLATLLAGSAAAEIMPIAIIAATVAWVIAVALSPAVTPTTADEEQPEDPPRALTEGSAGAS